MNLAGEMKKGEIEESGVSDEESAGSILEFIIRTASLTLGREVSADSDLFDLGLDSLGALEISTAIEERYSVEFPLGMVFEHPSASELAQLLA
jgi:acyl carrier protein